MKVECEYKDKIVYFEDLPVGTVFEFDGEFFLKFYCENNYNAVCFNGNSIHMFDEDVEVIPIEDAKLIIPKYRD